MRHAVSRAGLNCPNPAGEIALANRRVSIQPGHKETAEGKRVVGVAWRRRNSQAMDGMSEYELEVSIGESC